MVELEIIERELIKFKSRANPPKNSILKCLECVGQVKPNWLKKVWSYKMTDAYQRSGRFFAKGQVKPNWRFDRTRWLRCLSAFWKVLCEERSSNCHFFFVDRHFLKCRSPLEVLASKSYWNRSVHRHLNPRLPLQLCTIDQTSHRFGHSQTQICVFFELLKSLLSLLSNVSGLDKK